ASCIVIVPASALAPDPSTEAPVPLSRIVAFVSDSHSVYASSSSIFTSASDMSIAACPLPAATSLDGADNAEEATPVFASSLPPSPLHAVTKTAHSNREPSFIVQEFLIS